MIPWSIKTADQEMNIIITISTSSSSKDQITTIIPMGFGVDCWAEDHGKEIIKSIKLKTKGVIIIFGGIYFFFPPSLILTGF